MIIIDASMVRHVRALFGKESVVAKRRGSVVIIDGCDMQRAQNVGGLTGRLQNRHQLRMNNPFDLETNNVGTSHAYSRLRAARAPASLTFRITWLQWPRRVSLAQMIQFVLPR